MVGVPSVILSATLIAVMFMEQHPPQDWWTFTEAARRAGSDTLYEWDASPFGPEQPFAFRYSPLLAWAMVPVTALGIEAWRLLHVVALALLPWRVALLTLAFAPFWYDVLHGNFVTFSMVFGFLALKGSRWATIGYFALLVMMPRPLLIPVAAWIVWKRPEWRLPAVGFGLVGATTLLYPGFVAAVLAMSNFAMRDVLWPPAAFAVPWVGIGLALAALLSWKGRLGLASLAASPYLLPYYLPMLLLELAGPTRAAQSAPASIAVETPNSRLMADCPSRAHDVLDG